MKDSLVKAMALDGHVRLYINRTTDLVQEAMDRFRMSTPSADVLGRVLSVASIMGSMLKSEKEMLTINIQGQGELGSIVVDAQADGTVRGFVDNPEAGLDGDPNVTAGSLIGLPGTLTVTKDLSMSENWSGTVELQNGEIGQDFAYYFTLSEQTPTAVSVGVRMNEEGKVLAAGALVLQMMPDADDTNIRICEHVLSGLNPMTAIIQDYDDASLALLAEDLFDDTEVLETIPISFKCTCSKEKTAGLLHTVAPDQIKAMIEEDHGAEVTCNFCSSTYHFNEHELREILNDTEKHLEETEELESHVAEDSGN
ncbi:Hsp33 family molecular chaperone HslO [uncultured Allobaculum sp.]|uniref:Hsp33 family molecular chaperone HslO n=1 Tax=uncultured Allobaculum sp. TaxID=1187017 RepID=UPI00263B443D|nr:Hsp33 family molecular chaperone HslO [uncultured Allobaculum sp.]